MNFVQLSFLRPGVIPIRAQQLQNASRSVANAMQMRRAALLRFNLAVELALRSGADVA